MHLCENILSFLLIWHIGKWKGLEFKENFSQLKWKHPLNLIGERCGIYMKIEIKFLSNHGDLVTFSNDLIDELINKFFFILNARQIFVLEVLLLSPVNFIPQVYTHTLYWLKYTLFTINFYILVEPPTTKHTGKKLHLFLHFHPHV